MTMIDRFRSSPRIRLVLAVILTLGVLCYAWSRTFVMWMLQGQPEGRVVAALAVGLPVVIALTWNLSSRLVGTRPDRLVGWGIATTWIAMNGTLIALYSESVVPAYYLSAVFVAATLWVPWTAWMFYRPLRWRTRWGVLAFLLAALLTTGLCLRLDGMTGDNHLNFAWRWTTPTSDLGSVQPDRDMPSFAGKIDLTQTSADDFPQFLGPQRLAIVPQARLTGDWNAQPPKKVWRKPVGAGWSSFAIVGSFAITQEQRGPEECVVCYRVADGAVAWTKASSNALT